MVWRVKTRETPRDWTSGSVRFGSVRSRRPSTLTRARRVVRVVSFGMTTTTRERRGERGGGGKEHRVRSDGRRIVRYDDDDDDEWIDLDYA